jgi:epoxyqueuosine reductase QueG
VSANVIVRGEKKGATTDSTGYFRLELAAHQKHILAFNHVAYRKETRELAPGALKEVEFRMYLVPEPISLQEVVVYGNRDAALTKADENRAVHRLGGEEFEKLGGEDMEKALRYLLPDDVNRIEK